MGVATSAPTLVKLPSRDISTEDMGADRTVSLDTKFASVYEGHAYMKPDKHVRHATEKEIVLLKALYSYTEIR